MKPHPIADLFPMMTDDELKSLAADIKSNGLKEPIVVLDDKILDGRNRERACRIAKVETKTVAFRGKDPLAFVLSMNLHRRHLTQSQRAAIGVKVEELFAAQAKERMSKGGGDHKSQKAKSGVENLPPPIAPIKARDQAGKAMGVSGRHVGTAKKLKQAAPEKFDAVLSGEKTLTQAVREVREGVREQKRQENAVKAAETDVTELAGVFSTIVLDPPWDWGDEGDVNQMGRAKPDYATMSLEQMLELPVGKFADTDCHLYCWVTNRSMPKVFALIERWGFRYVTLLTWPKKSFGMGNYFRGQTEHVVFAVKGSQTLKTKSASTLLPAWDRGKGHSSKPPEFREFVEGCSPGPYLEFFARSKREGWTSWGADV